jgi:uncharacterized protein (DUF1330 family)
MAAYLIANIEVTDPAAYEEYRRRAPAVIAAYGGRYLARGGTVTLLEGDARLQRVVVLEFPNMAQLKAFHASSEYQSLVAGRQRAARSIMYGVEGL